MSKNRYCVVTKEDCVACGACVKVCPKAAVTVVLGMYAQIDENKCIGCGLCMKECPASVITRRELSS